MRHLCQGDRGREVIDVQTRLIEIGFSLGKEGVDGRFGPTTAAAVRSFQDARGIPADGIIGKETWDHLVRASYVLGDRLLYLRLPFTIGDDIAILQNLLKRLGFYTGPMDGVYGSLTDAAVREFQYSTGVHSDGIVGPETIKALEKLRHALVGVETIDFPDREDMKRSIYNLAGLKIAIDSGHGYPPDPGAVGPTGLMESEVAADIAQRLADLVNLAEGQSFRLGPGTLSERAEIANTQDAGLFVSIHLNGSLDPGVQGTVTLYFPTSMLGRVYAERVQARLVQAIGTVDMGAKSKNLYLLRGTKMPAILVEPCFITNKETEAMLREDAYMQKIAVAIFDGICQASSMIKQQGARA